MKNKGQVALEFLMTYGWALLIILVAITALAYFGVLNLDQFIPQRCNLPAGITCLNTKATSDSLLLVLHNSMGEDINVTNIRISTCNDSSNVEMLKDNTYIFNLTGCSNGAPGKRLKDEINMTFYDSYKIPHVRYGDIVTMVEES